MTDENLFHTTDFRISAYLLSQGIKLVRIDRGNGPKATFVFQDNGRINELIKSYWQDEAFVNPKHIYNAQKELKELLYGQYEI